MEKGELLTIKDAKIFSRNFSGRPGTYNDEGERNFCVILDDEIADRLKQDGWNVKYLRPRDDNDEPVPFIQVNVRFNHDPEKKRFPDPIIYIVSSTGKTRLYEDEVTALDYGYFEKWSVSIRPHRWSYGNRAGVKGVLKTLYATISEDEIDLMYSNVPDSAVKEAEDE